MPEASWGLAQIDLARENRDSALPRLAESYQILGQLQRPDGIAVVGWALGQLLADTGQPSQARQVLAAAQAAATTIGWTDLARQASGHAF